MTTTPTPDNPHTDPDAELPETVAVHIEWLRRPGPHRSHTQVDDRQSADYLERLLAVAHRLAERAEQAVADRDRLAARVETLEGALGKLIDPASNPTLYANAAARRMLRALVAPDTPTSPTDQCPRCHRKVSDHDLATVADACPDPDEAPTARCVDCEHRWIDHGAAGCGFSYCRCTEPRPTSPTDTGDPT